MKNNGENKSRSRLHAFELLCYLAVFSPMYVKLFFEPSYFLGITVGFFCAWGINNVFYIIPKEQEKLTLHHQIEKRKKVKKLLCLLKAIETQKIEAIKANELQ